MQLDIDLSKMPNVAAFFDKSTNTISYIVSDPSTGACAIIDSVMDIDYAAGRITHHGADEMVAHIKSNKLTLEWIIETHVHADHLSEIMLMQNYSFSVSVTIHKCYFQSVLVISKNAFIN